MDFDIAVIICCHNSAERIGPTLRHLARQETPDGVRWQVVLVDNNCNDDTVAIARRIWADGFPVPFRVVEARTPGLVHARLVGVAAADAGILAFVDDDNWVEDKWVAKIAMLFAQHPEWGIVGSCAEPVFDSPPAPWVCRYLDAYALGPQGPREGALPFGAAVYGAGLAIRKSVWQAIFSSGYAPLLTGRTGRHLLSGEDTEICLLAQMAGWQVAYSPGLTLQHFVPRGRLTWDYLRRIAAGNGRADVRLSLYRAVLGQRTWAATLIRTSWPLVLLYRAGQFSRWALAKRWTRPVEGHAGEIEGERTWYRFVETWRMRSSLRPWFDRIAQHACRLDRSTMARRPE